MVHGLQNLLEKYQVVKRTCHTEKESLKPDRDPKKECWLQNDLYHLKLEEKGMLLSEKTWLNNTIMDAAQILICKALGKKDSYQTRKRRAGRHS